jgi:hypothetical protein
LRKSAFCEVTTEVASKLYDVPPIENDQSVNGELNEGLKGKRENDASVPAGATENVPVAPERTIGSPVPSGPTSEEKAVAVSSGPFRFAPPTNSIVPVIKGAENTGKAKVTIANPINPAVSCLKIGCFTVLEQKSSQNRLARNQFLA